MPDTMGTLSSLEEQHFVRGSLEREGCDSGLGPKIGQKFIFVDSLWYVVHDTRLVESFRLRPLG